MYMGRTANMIWDAEQLKRIVKQGKVTTGVRSKYSAINQYHIATEVEVHQAIKEGWHILWFEDKSHNLEAHLYNPTKPTPIVW